MLTKPTRELVAVVTATGHTVRPRPLRVQREGGGGGGAKKEAWGGGGTTRGKGVGHGWLLPSISLSLSSDRRSQAPQTVK